jgi:hypothetical protein
MDADLVTVAAGAIAFDQCALAEHTRKAAGRATSVRFRHD